MQTLLTGELSPNELAAELPLTIESLKTQGFVNMKFMIGWGADLSFDGLWKERECDLDQALREIEKASREGILRLGFADIFLRSTTDQTEVLFSHHFQIQVTSSSGSLMAATLERWAQSGYEVFRRRADGTWISITAP